MSLEDHRKPNGNYDGVGVMSEVTGLARDEIRAIAEQVKANSAKLRACPWHEFEPALGFQQMNTAPPIGRERYRCKHCQGEVDSSAYHWHEQGRRVKPAATEAEWQELIRMIENSTCSRILRAVGKPYPRTCQVHGLTCGMPAPDAQSDALA